jgi:hypothetical protein
MDPNVTTVVVAGIGIVGTATGSVISYRAAKEAAHEETERLRIQYRDAQRDSRRAIYVQVLNALDGFKVLAGGRSPTDEQLDETWAEYRDLRSKLALVGAARVVIAFGSIGKVVRDILEDPSWTEGDDPDIVRWRRAYAQHHSRIEELRVKLVAAMRDDLIEDAFEA